MGLLKIVEKAPRVWSRGDLVDEATAGRAVVNPGSGPFLKRRIPLPWLIVPILLAGVLVALVVSVRVSTPDSPRERLTARAPDVSRDGTATGCRLK